VSSQDRPYPFEQDLREILGVYRQAQREIAHLITTRSPPRT
jgi:hypothetical protein